MSPVEAVVLGAAFSREIAKHSATDNSAAETALDAALWELACFRQAVRERKADS